MDPDEVYRYLVISANLNPDEKWSKAFRDLDEWLGQGGFLPGPWSR